MAMDENNRAAAMLLDDFLKVHGKLMRQRKAQNTGKQPKRYKPPVHAWRANDNSAQPFIPRHRHKQR